MKKQTKKIIFVVSFLVVVSLLVFLINLNQEEITNFEECASAGFPVGESYPRQCWDSYGNHFIEEIEEEWRLDSIQLRHHETEGYYGCFGCGKILCVDPIFEMKEVPETAERYCTDEFEVIEK